VSFDAAVFTNLAPEHLDFHHTMEEYAAAKAHLFELLDRPTAKEWLRMGVVNADDPASLTMVGASSVGIVSYAIDAYADLRARDIETGLGGSRFLLETPIGEQYVWTHLVGRHNIANALAAAAVGLGWGLDVDTIVEGIASAKLPAGRMQQIDRGQPFRVVVDFAHTPQALATTIASLRAATEGSVFLVFGLAGGRDAANRPVMGELAARETDYFVISTDDPLHEDPATIAAAVAAGAAATGAVNGRDFTVELDRRAAIEHVLRRAGPGDVVLLAGKGHEQRMLVADRVEPWNDAEVASGILATLGYR
jgi:UDP-N-acetylmuramoyl-L-alanyl-D-glutamate--2,6-diaminopimelate ligase